jgi:hypothetical protein
MTLLAAPQAEPWPVLALTSLSLGCAPERVGAAPCFDASRLARNGRDWHHLLGLCGLVEARVINLDGVYNPCRPNDRLLLGMKGSISEFELGVLPTRMLAAVRAKARRGELRIFVPIGYIWHREVGLGFDPDLRVQEAIRVIFRLFRQLGSARQVHLLLRADEVHFPRPSDGRKLFAFDWTPIRYRNGISVLKNPFYAGVYAYGKLSPWQSRRHCWRNGCIWKANANNSASLNWSCTKPAMKPRLPSGATLAATRITA